MAIKFLSDLQTYGTINVGEEISSWNHGPSGKLQVNTPNNTTGFKIDIGGGKAVYSFSGNSTSGYLTFFKTDDVASYIGQDSAWRDLRFQTNSSDRIVIKGNGNVGIGTTTPTEKLEVIGNLKAEGLRIGSSIALFNYFNDLIITAPTSQNIILGGGPGSVLNDVKVANGDLYVSGAYYDSSNSTGTSGQVLSSTVSGTDWVSLSEIQGIDGTGTANYITKWSDSDTVTDSIMYDDGTKVGIGTTSPYKTLDVQGEAVVSQNLWIGPVGGNDAANSLEIGRGRTGDGICFIDMTTDNTTYTDYGFRLIRYSGVNANTELVHRGTGDFRIKGQEASTMTFYTGNSARMRVASNGNVGIGTTNPSYMLDVGGGDFFVNGINRDWGGVGGLGTHIGTGDFDIYAGVPGSGTHKLKVTNAGNVGIGTTSPSRELSIGDGTGSPNIQLLASTVGNSRIEFGDNDDSDAGEIQYVHSSNYMQFTTNGAEKMRILSNGNVGIGTTSPNGKLEVNGIVKIGNVTTGLSMNGSSATEFLISGADTSGNAWNSIHIKADGDDGLFIEKDTNNVGIGTTNPDSLLHVSADVSSSEVNKTGTITIEGRPYGILGDDIATIDFHNNGNKRSDIRMERGNAADDSQLVFSTSDTGTLTDRLIINEAGNVGIGTTSPEVQLQIGDHTGTERILLYGANSTNVSSEVIFADSSGGQAIYKFGTGLRFDTASNVLSVRGFYNGQTAADFSFVDFYRNVNTTTTPIRFNYDTSFSGNVGIGTTSPSSELDVNGTGTFGTGSAYALKLKSSTGARGIEISDSSGVDRGGIDWSGSDFIIRNASDNDLLKINYSSKQVNLYGNVGIGTTSPSQKLHVAGIGEFAGALRITEQSTSQNILIGNQDSSGANTPAIINGVNGALRFGKGNSWSGEGGTFTEAMRVALNSNVGIGTTNPSAKLDVAGNIKADNYVSVQGVDTGNPSASSEELRLSGYGVLGNRSAMYITNGHSTGTLRFGIGSPGNHGSNTKMLLDNSGNVGIGTTSPSAKLHVVGRVASATGNGFEIINSYGSPRLSDFYGTFYTTSALYVGSPYSAQACYASAFNINSDYRLKENEVPLTKAYSRIKKLKPIRFNYISSENTVDGFLAHEVAEVIPEAVTGEKDAVREDGSDELQGLDQSKIVPLLTAALQEAIEKIEQLEIRIQTLENN